MIENHTRILCIITNIGMTYSFSQIAKVSGRSILDLIAVNKDWSRIVVTDSKDETRQIQLNPVEESVFYLM